MHDIKFIKEFSEKFDQMLIARGYKPQAENIIRQAENLHLQQIELQKLNTKRNEIAKQIGQLKSTGDSTEALLTEGDKTKHQCQALESIIGKLQNELEGLLQLQPNMIDDEVPFGKDDSENQEIRQVGIPKEFNFSPKEHFELGENLQMMDFTQTAKISGSRFVTLKADLARMERALANFMLDIHTKEFGYTEMCTPALVRQSAVYGTGQYPNLDGNLFETINGYYLVPTSEVPLTNLVADSITPEERLPLRFAAYSPCFRSEAGSAGKDTTGMIRMHQFSKVELVSITTPNESQIEHKRMISAAEEILNRLELPYRITILCTGDIGFSARKTYDLEVWLPGQGRYREISSCSNCGDFQARRIKARYKALKNNNNYFVHTLNGSGLPIGRTIIAIMENYQNADGSISIPEALQPYMGGLKLIKKE